MGLSIGAAASLEFHAAISEISVALITLGFRSPAPQDSGQFAGEETNASFKLLELHLLDLNDSHF